MKGEVEFVRLVGNERRVGPTLKSVSHHWQGDRECFLFISPHDDDIVLGGVGWHEYNDYEKRHCASCNKTNTEKEQ